MGKRRRNRKAGTQHFSKGDGDWRREGSTFATGGREGYSSGGWGDNSTTGGKTKNYYESFKWKPNPTCAFILYGEKGPDGKPITTSIWGGSAAEMVYTPVKLLVCLEQVPNAYRPMPRVTLAKEAEKYFTEASRKALILPTCPWVSLHWPDYGVPRLNQVWWKTFVEQIANVGGPVGFCCSGGVGRTGTALAIVAAIGGAMDNDDDPVRFVREHYFDDCVESDEQIRYIERITGKTVHEPLYGYRDYQKGWKSGVIGETASNSSQTTEVVQINGTTIKVDENNRIVGGYVPNLSVAPTPTNATGRSEPEEKGGLIKSAIESAKVFFKDGAM